MDKYRLGGEKRRETVEDDATHSVVLRQIIALRDFADVHAGQAGGWVEDCHNLSQSGDCWIYDENSEVYGGARVEGNAHISGSCTLSLGARVIDDAHLDSCIISHRACIGGKADVSHSEVRGECLIDGEVRVIDSRVFGARGLTADDQQILHIGGRAQVTGSTLAHQAQIYGDCQLTHAFVEHRAQVYGHAHLEGNELNNVWVCDCAKVYGFARLLAGSEPDQIPTLRYSAEAFDQAVIQGDCLLKHHVRVYGSAHLSGGPLLLDDHVEVYGDALISGEAIVSGHVRVFEHAAIVALPGDVIQIRSHQAICGDQRITRSLPFVGFNPG